MKKRIFRSMCILVIVAILFSSILVVAALFPHFNSQMYQEIKTEAAYLAAGLNEADNKLTFLHASEIRHQSTRITLIAGDGTVLFDNKAQAANMDNHLLRPEITEALENGSAQSVRRSQTLGNQTFYYAVKLNDGTVIRLATTTGNFLTAVVSVLPYLLPIVLVVFFLALFLAQKMTRRIVDPINALDLESPLKNQVYEELLPLLSRIKAQNKQIELHMEELRAKQEDFLAITSHMSEGLITLDPKGNVLTVNPSALRLLSASKSFHEGQNILTLNRNLTLKQAAQTALKGEHFDGLLTTKNRTCRLFASPVYERDEIIKGAIIFVLDVTEQQKAEQIRREFSANVSHELKTPLTSISGYAELLENGLVKPEDIPTFAERIHCEAHRLINLVESIIKLSGLEEKKIQVEWKKVDLLELVQSIAQRLKPQAREKNIEIAVAGEGAIIWAVKQMIDELITNLCENAIKYNKPQGRVEINIYRDHRKTVLCVADTGIGIPLEHQERIFERFYRVDKSHSKQTEGTGLGLSIVKHIAEYHQAEINLESSENQGTKITVAFSDVDGIQETEFGLRDSHK
ncbi:MAG: PAS domain-containing protein [Peptococcaceae bacterium]|nr:PAS domain-containing protein [Peptococcaceae bacterium]